MRNEKRVYNKYQNMFLLHAYDIRYNIFTNAYRFSHIGNIKCSPIIITIMIVIIQSSRIFRHDILIYFVFQSMMSCHLFKILSQVCPLYYTKQTQSSLNRIHCIKEVGVLENWGTIIHVYNRLCNCNDQIMHT